MILKPSEIAPLSSMILAEPLKVFDIIGYGKTATSPVEAEPMKYLKPEDKKIMNRNSLLEASMEILNNNKDFKVPFYK